MFNNEKWSQRSKKLKAKMKEKESHECEGVQKKWLWKIRTKTSSYI